VQLTDSQCYLRAVEPDSIFAEALLTLEDLIELSTLDKRHYEVKPQLRLEQEVHAHQERVVSSEENIFLQESTLYLIMFNEHILPNGLDSVELLIHVQLCKVHSAESASANLLLDIEVV